MFISKSNADYVPNLTSAVRQYQADLVISVGFLMGDATAQVAQALPADEVRDHRQHGRRRRAQGQADERARDPLQGAGGGLPRRLPRRAAGEERPAGQQLVAAVGGLKIPPVDRFIAGYYQGAKKAFPAVKVQHTYSQDFVDQAKCKEQALNHIADGASVVFAVAGQCGLGVLSAAKEKSRFGIGVDADQWYLGNHVLTSATKKVDVAVLEHDLERRSRPAPSSGRTSTPSSP